MLPNSGCGPEKLWYFKLWALTGLLMHACEGYCGKNRGPGDSFSITPAPSAAQTPPAPITQHQHILLWVREKPAGSEQRSPLQRAANTHSRQELNQRRRAAAPVRKARRRAGGSSVWYSSKPFSSEVWLRLSLCTCRQKHPPPSTRPPWHRRPVAWQRARSGCPSRSSSRRMAGGERRIAARSSVRLGAGRERSERGVHAAVCVFNLCVLAWGCVPPLHARHHRSYVTAGCCVTPPTCSHLALLFPSTAQLTRSSAFIVHLHICPHHQFTHSLPFYWGFEDYKICLS